MAKTRRIGHADPGRDAHRSRPGRVVFLGDSVPVRPGPCQRTVAPLLGSPLRGARLRSHRRAETTHLGRPRGRGVLRAEYLHYPRRDHLATAPALQEEFSRTRVGQLSIVHPLQYNSMCEPALLPIQALVEMLVRRVARTVRSRLQPARRRSQIERLTRARDGGRAVTAARDEARRQ